MSNNPQGHPPDSKNPLNPDTSGELERQIRRERKFSLQEAIGRLAGPGMMKGTSPVTCKKQAEAEIQDYLSRYLADAEGALAPVLLRQISQSELLLNNLDQPRAVLAAYLRQTLDSPYFLNELVREADVEWGRIYGERPYFTAPQQAQPDPDDPYTSESVRAKLTELLDSLAA